MNIKAVAGVAALVAVVAAGAGYALLVLPGQQFRSSLDEMITNLPETMTARYDSADYGLFDRTAAIEGVTLDWQAAPAYTIRIDRVELVEPAADLAEAFAQARANPAAVDSDLSLPVARSIRFTGVEGEIKPDQAAGIEAGTYTLDRFEIANLRLYPKALLQWDLQRTLMLAEQLQTVSSDAAPAEVLARMQPLFEEYAALYLGFAYDSYVVDNVAADLRIDPAATTTQPTPPGPVETAVRVARATSGGYDRGVSAAASMTGFRQTVGDIFACAVDRIGVGAFDIRAAAEQVLAGAPLAGGLLDQIVFGDLEVAMVDCRSAEAGPIVFDRFAVNDLRFTNGLPASLRLSLDGLKAPPESLAMAAPDSPLALLDLDTLTVSAGASYDWDRANSRIALTDVNLAVSELGQIAVDAELVDVPADPAAVEAMKLSAATVRFTDASLVDRLIEQVALQQGANPADLRAQLMALMAHQSADLGLPPAIADALVDFIRSPGLLTITLNPPVPVPVQTLEQAETMPPARFVELVGLRVSTTR